MGIHDKSLITVLGVSLLLVLVAAPLALRMIPRNAVYGFRTRATLANDDLWFSANAYFGRSLIVAIAGGCVSAVATHFLIPVPADKAVPVSVLFVALPSVIAALATARFVRRRQGGGR